MKIDRKEEQKRRKMPVQNRIYLAVILIFIIVLLARSCLLNRGGTISSVYHTKYSGACEAAPKENYGLEYSDSWAQKGVPWESPYVVVDTDDVTVQIVDGGFLCTEELQRGELDPYQYPYVVEVYAENRIEEEITVSFEDVSVGGITTEMGSFTVQKGILTGAYDPETAVPESNGWGMLYLAEHRSELDGVSGDITGTLRIYQGANELENLIYEGEFCVGMDGSNP